MLARAPERVRRLALLGTSPKGILPAVRKHYVDSIGSFGADGLGAYLADGTRLQFVFCGAHPSHFARALFRLIDFLLRRFLHSREHTWLCFPPL